MGVVNFDHGSTYIPQYSGGSSVANRFTSNKQLRLTAWRVHVGAFSGNVSLRVFRVSDGVVVYAGSQVSTYSSSDVWLEFSIPGGVILESGVQYSYGVAVHAATKLYTKSASTSDHDHTGDSGGVILATKAGGWLGSDVSAMPSGSTSNEIEVGLVYTTNTAPNAPAWTTADGQTVDVAADSVLSWAFSDPDPGDSQSQFVLDRWALDSNGARVGAAVRTTVSTPVTSYTIPGGSLVAGTRYEFKVATRDAQGAPTLDSALAFSTSLFRTFNAKPGVPTITAPANGATVNNAATLTWSTPQQDAYQVQVLDGSGVLVPGTDTGEVTDAVTRSVTLAFPTNNVTRTPRIRRKVGGLWSEWATVTVTVSWTAPPAPTGVKAPVPASGAIDLTITNPAPGAGQPTVAYNDIYYAEPGEPEERKATLVPPNSTWRHWLPASDAVYTYRIVAVASNGTTSETVVS